MLLRPGLHCAAAETNHRAQPQPLRPPVLSDLGRRQEGRLAVRAATALAAAGCPAQIGVVHLHEAPQRLAVIPLAHRLHQFVLEHPSRVVAHAQRAQQVHRREAILGLREQVDRQVPSGQRQLGVSNTVPAVSETCRWQRMHWKTLRVCSWQSLC